MPVEQLISFITRYNYELDKQPVVREKVQKCHNMIFRIFKVYNRMFFIDPMIWFDPMILIEIEIK